MATIQRVGILHGIGGSGALHWQTWLAKKCRTLGLETLYPKLPNKDRPDLAEWLSALDSEMPKIDGKTALVGHSLGCPAILQMIKRKSIREAGLVILVAPPSLSKIRASPAPFLAPFLENIDYPAIISKAKRIEIFISDNDQWSTPNEIRVLAKNLHANLHFIENGGHLNIASGHHTFRQVLKLITANSAAKSQAGA